MYIPSKLCVMLVCKCSHQPLLLSVYIADESSETYFLNERWRSFTLLMQTNYRNSTPEAPTHTQWGGYNVYVPISVNGVF